MNRRILAWTAALALASMLIGLAGLDRPLAEWIHASPVAHARVFADGLAALDAIVGVHVWFWLAALVVFSAGVALLLARRDSRFALALTGAGVVQFAALWTMIAGKTLFGRLRPEQMFAADDPASIWFAGGGSFPSGHAAFYFGLLLPLAAACRNRAASALLIAIPVYVSLARIDLEKHFLSDVSASALIASLYALAFATLAQRIAPMR